MCTGYIGFERKGPNMWVSSPFFNAHGFRTHYNYFQTPTFKWMLPITITSITKWLIENQGFVGVCSSKTLFLYHFSP